MSRHKSLFVMITFLFLLSLTVAVRAETAADAQDSWKIPQGDLSLKQAHDIALQHSPSLDEATARINAAVAVLKQATSVWSPRLTARGSSFYHDGVQQLDWQPEVRAHDSFAQHGAAVELGWLVFDGFAREANILQSRYRIEQQQQLQAETTRLLLKAVSRAYYQAQMALEEMVVAQENRKFNRILEDESKKRWLAGAIPEAEMLNFSVRALQAESDFLSADERFKVACAALTELMGLNQGDTRLPQRAERDVLAEMPYDFATENAFALEHRSDLQAIDRQMLALQQQDRTVKATFYPTAHLVGGTSWSKAEDQGDTDQTEHDSYAGVNLNWDLFEGGQRVAQRREIDAQINQLKAQRRQTELEIQSQLRQDLDQARAALAIFKKQQLTFELTYKIRSHIEQAYRAGVETLTRLNEAQTDLVKASGSVAQSRINYLLALEMVASTTGRILNESRE
nr:TolC family protein [uncultured Desulfuromonas sp.]